MGSKFGLYENRFFDTFKENRDKIIQNREQFANSNTVEEFIDEHFEAEKR